MNGSGVVQPPRRMSEPPLREHVPTPPQAVLRNRHSAASGRLTLRPEHGSTTANDKGAPWRLSSTMSVEPGGGNASRSVGRPGNCGGITFPDDSRKVPLIALNKRVSVG